ncbi:MAG: hypothetical protein ACPGXI_15840, partial [Mycobacterium sp.]
MSDSRSGTPKETSELSFADRHIGPDARAVDTLLSTIGVESLDELAAKAVPADILDLMDADLMDADLIDADLIDADG